MSQVFLDTSFLIAVVLSDDALHRRAIAWRSKLRGPFVTTEFVLIEFGDALSAPRNRALADRAIRAMRSRADITILPASSDAFGRGLELFRSRTDKAWSLTDCISFSSMSEQGIQEALSYDQHFEQAGFRALLRVEA